MCCAHQSIEASNPSLYIIIMCGSKGPVIIYDRGGSESNDFLWKIFSRPTRRAEKKIRGPLDIERKIFDAHSYG